jgi:hypothetical protein
LADYRKTGLGAGFDEWLHEADRVFASQGVTMFDYADEEDVMQVFIDGEDPVEWALEVMD